MIPRMTRRRWLFSSAVAGLGALGYGGWRAVQQVRDAAGRSTSQ